jgi:hypothetical protein
MHGIASCVAGFHAACSSALFYVVAGVGVGQVVCVAEGEGEGCMAWHCLSFEGAPKAYESPGFGCAPPVLTGGLLTSTSLTTLRE